MPFRKNRSQHFWVFSSYSLVFHLAGFLALAVFIGSHAPDSASSPISVRLVDVMPVTPQVAPIPTVPQAPQADIVATSQKPFTPVGPPSPDLFHMVRQADTSSSPIRQIMVGTNRNLHSIDRVTSTALPSKTLDQPIYQVTRINDLAHSNTRILVDHKAEQSLTATTPPKILFNPVPSYPRIARKLGLEGQTLLRVEILQNGRTGTVKVRESCGHTVLDEAAAKAIKKWKFTPAQDGLFAVRSVVDLPVRFSLKSLG